MTEGLQLEANANPFAGALDQVHLIYQTMETHQQQNEERAAALKRDGTRDVLSPERESTDDTPAQERSPVAKSSVSLKDESLSADEAPLT